MLLIKNDRHIDKKSWGGCHPFLLVHDASKLSLEGWRWSFIRGMD